MSQEIKKFYEHFNYLDGTVYIGFDGKRIEIARNRKVNSPLPVVAIAIDENSVVRQTGESFGNTSMVSVDREKFTLLLAKFLEDVEKLPRAE